MSNIERAKQRGYIAVIAGVVGWIAYVANQEGIGGDAAGLVAGIAVITAGIAFILALLAALSPSKPNGDTAPTGAHEGDMNARLAELEQLRTDGAVDDDEYAEQRSRILGDL